MVVLAPVEGDAWFCPLPAAVAASAGTATAGALASVEGDAWPWPLPAAVAALPSVVPPPAEVPAANAPPAGATSRAAVVTRWIARIVPFLGTATPARP